MSLPYATTTQVEKISKEIIKSESVELEKKIEQSASTVEDGVLKVSKIEVPQPIITIDGVNYYHKCEFDLETLENGYYDLLTGEVWTQGEEERAVLYKKFQGRNVIGLHLGITTPVSIPINIAIIDAEEIFYTSHSFIVVDGRITDNTQICLPECSAYYGFLSGNNKTFISYYNLLTDVVAPVTLVSDGTTQLEIHDARLEVTAADAGKMVAVNENGELILVTPEFDSAIVVDDIDFSKDDFGSGASQLPAEDESDLTDAKVTDYTNKLKSLIKRGYVIFNSTLLKLSWIMSITNAIVASFGENSGNVYGAKVVVNINSTGKTYTFTIEEI